MTNPDDKRNMRLLLLVLLPTLCWLGAAKATKNLTHPELRALLSLLKTTHEKPLLLLGAVCGLSLAIVLIWFMNKFENSAFHGAYFRKFLRGTKIVSASQLKSLTKEKGIEQLMIAEIPIPTQVENLHLLVAGSTGSGKSVLIR